MPCQFFFLHSSTIFFFNHSVLFSILFSSISIHLSLLFIFPVIFSSFCSHCKFFTRCTPVRVPAVLFVCNFNPHSTIISPFPYHWILLYLFWFEVILSHALSSVDCISLLQRNHFARLLLFSFSLHSCLRCHFRLLHPPFTWHLKRVQIRGGIRCMWITMR